MQENNAKTLRLFTLLGLRPSAHQFGSGIKQFGRVHLNLHRLRELLLHGVYVPNIAKVSKNKIEYDIVCHSISKEPRSKGLNLSNRREIRFAEVIEFDRDID
jgi:hypothetical protein